MKDSDLLIQFTQGSEPAFAELVRRHLDLVFGAALRQVAGDRHQAEDITQQVFIDLARKARTLTRHPTLAGWLYASTRYTALNARRSEQRRVERETSSEFMNTAAGNEPRWEQIRPVIDEALQELDEDDRQSVLLRFFGQQPFAAIAAQLGITENAAQKRVDRALDRLHAALQRRGISSTAAAVAVALGDACVAAPVPLAGTVTAAALAQAGAGGAGTLALAGWLKLAAVAATVGVIGWTAVSWSKPAEVEPQPPAPATAMPAAKPAQTGLALPLVPLAAAPKPAEPLPLPDRPLEKAAPLPTPVRQVHVVNRGETLSRIARAAGISAAALAAENPGYDFARMRVGDQLLLPANATVPPPVAPTKAPPPIPADELYHVQPGDTLSAIAQKRDLRPDELKTLNPGTNWEQLRIGQPIRAP